MTVYKGMLLFDVAEPAIGKWENQLGYRGMLEVWRHSETKDEVRIEPDEDVQEGNQWVVFIEDDDISQSIAFGTFDQCDQAAKEWMSQHPNGIGQ